MYNLSSSLSFLIVPYHCNFYENSEEVCFHPPSPSRTYFAFWGMELSGPIQLQLLETRVDTANVRDMQDLY